MEQFFLVLTAFFTRQMGGVECDFAFSRLLTYEFPQHVVGYSSDALQKIESFFKRSHKVIVALTVQEILDEHIAKKLA